MKINVFAAISVFILMVTGAAFGATGGLDLTFGSGGKVLATIAGTEAAYDVAVQPDGKIVFATGTIGPDNTADFAVCRLNQNGSTDTDFGTGGKVVFRFDVGANERPTSIAVQPDGKIVVAGLAEFGSPGYDFGVARLNADGTLDSSFGTGGLLKVPVSSGPDYASDMVLQSDGKIVIVGKCRPTPNDDGAIVRINANGSLDTSFNGTGKRVFAIGAGAANDTVDGVAIQPDGKIVIAGGDDADFAIIRLNSNGTPDSSFDGDGVVTTPIGTQRDEAHSVAIQADGKIVAGGFANSGSGNSAALVRYLSNGALDTTFDGDGKLTLGAGPTVIKSIIPQPGGKILAAGTGGDAIFSGNFVLALFNDDGTPDTGFGTGGVVTTAFGNNDSSLDAAVAQADGKIVAAGSGRNGSGDYSFAAVRYLMTEPPVRKTFDYDGDGKSDVSVFRPSTGAWYLNRSTAGIIGMTWGVATDVITPADYDGDGKTDVAVFRPSEGRWYIFNSATSTFTSSLWGASTDIPAPADYDGDGKADVSIFRPSDGNWWLNRSTAGTIATQFGQNGDIPAVGDYDGDGKSDIGIFRPSNGVWFIRRSTAGDIGYQFGFGTDKITPADYDGDGKTDIAIYRPSTGQWFIANSGSATYPVIGFGAATDIPTPGDYDGDGKADVAIFRPSDGNWWLNQSTAGVTVTGFGQNGDKPTENAYGN